MYLRSDYSLVDLLPLKIRIKAEEIKVKNMPIVDTTLEITVLYILSCFNVSIITIAAKRKSMSNIQAIYPCFFLRQTLYKTFQNATLAPK